MESLADMLEETPPTKQRTMKEKLTELAEIYNAKQGNMNELDCPICKNKGYIRIVKFDDEYQDYITLVKECECMPKRKIIQNARKSGLGEYLNKCFEDYIVTSEWQQKMLDQAKKYASRNTNEWFVLLGQSGSGKTMLSCIVANDLLLNKNRKVIYITWTDFISKLKRDMMGDNSNNVSKYLDEIKKVDVLFIDELLKKYNETDLRYIIEIINYRYTNDLKTIITSERVLKELLEIDEATFSRMVEKSNRFIANIEKDQKKNYRLKKLL